MFLAGSPIVEVDARALANSGRYSGDNILISLRLANGSEGTISYLANGDRSFSKERIEVFGGGAVAVLEDFRRLELVRSGHKEVIHSRWRQDKGYAAEWNAFAQFVRGQGVVPINFEDIACSTLATLRINQSITSAKRMAVDVADFIAAAHRTTSADSSLDSAQNQ